MRSRGRDRLLRRLKKIEERHLPRPARVDTSAVWARLLPAMGRGCPEAVRRALQDLPTWDLLIPTMHPEHVAIVLDTFANDDWVSAQTGRSSLALAVYHALGGVWSGPIAIPKAVGEVYLNDAEALPIHSCEACGYRIPTYAGPGSEQREVYFAKCPLCGGRIRWELMRMSDSPVGSDGYPLQTPETNQDD